MAAQRRDDDRTPDGDRRWPHRCARRATPWLRALVVAVLASAAGTALAQRCMQEVEPNDAPQQAIPLAGLRCAAGELDGQDQDAFAWEVSDEEALLWWSIEVEGIEGHLTRVDVVDVDLTADGAGVASARTLVGAGTSDGRLQASEPFLIAPGRYVLGVSKSGGSGAYVVHLRQGADPLGGRGAELRRGRQRHDASPSERGSHGRFGLAEGDLTWGWEIDEVAARSRWDLVLHASAGAAPTLELVAPDGSVVAQATADEGAARIASLGLAAGRYELRVVGVEPGAPIVVDATSGGVLTDGGEVEPNDGWAVANALSFEHPLDATGPGADYFLFDVDEARAGTAIDVAIESEATLRVRLYDPDGRLLQDRRGAGGTLRGLVLAAGRYGLIVDPDAGSYQVALRPGNPPGEGYEQEPNDTVPGASPMSADHGIRGELGPQDVDVLRFTVEGEPGVWRIQAIGEGLTAIAALDGGGNEHVRVTGAGRLRIDNVVLAPGHHHVRVEGEGAYALRAIYIGEVSLPAEVDPERVEEALRPAPAPPADPAADAATRPSSEDASALTVPVGPPPPPGVIESEPNDASVGAEPLHPGVVRVGTLSNDRDVDRYRFVLEHDAYVRLEAVPPEDGRVSFDTTRSNRAVAFATGEPAVLERHLIAGDYEVLLWATESSDGWYQLRLSFLDPIALPDDLEPNDQEHEAVPLPSDLTVVGRVGEMSDADFFELPVFDHETTVRFDGALDGVRLTLYGSEAPLRRADDGAWEGTLPAGTPTRVRLQGQSNYEVRVAFDTPPDPSQLRLPREGSGVELQVASERHEVAAYLREGQTLRGEFTLTNVTGEPLDVEFVSETSLLPARVTLPNGTSVAAGAEVRLPYSVDLPPDLGDADPFRLTIAARTAGGVATAPVTVGAICEAPPVEPALRFDLPERLLGHVNVALGVFGAVIVEADPITDVFLNDGHTSPRRGAYRDLGEPFTIDLAGATPHLLTGILLHPQSRPIEQQMRRFELHASTDGQSYERVLVGELAAARVEQAFVIDPPVAARSVRLVPLDAHAPSAGAWVGEWKVLAAGAPAFEGRDLADARLGGYQVWTDPFLPVDAVLAGGPTGSRVDGRDLDEMTWVVGFHHGRAAQVARFEWLEAEQSDPDTWFTTVGVDVSLTGPIGPWQELTEWTLERDGDGLAVLELEAPIWARWLRVRATGSDPVARFTYAPDEFRVVERLPGDGYASILGEWGHYASSGPYERMLAASAGPAPDRVADDGSDDERSGARPLTDGDVVVGTVLVAEDEDWYRVDVQAGDNHLELRLDLDGGTVRYRFVDGEGSPVVHDRREEGSVTVLEAFVEEGSYYLHLDEPKRSVVFSWDTSGSVGPFVPLTYASVSSFARDLDPEREVAQMLAFADPAPIWLLPYWGGDPSYVSGHLSAFDRATAASSEAEAAMLEAIGALAQREGTRALLFITDHESGSYHLTPELWRAIESARPSIFTFEVSSAGSGITQDRMQAYAMANGGFYQFARGVGDFDLGYRRAACQLRRPKTYTVEVAMNYRAPPGPGSLSVRHAGEAALPGVEIVFDASGSMGTRLPSGESRIDAARGVLRALVEEVLPEGVPFALRAFGHITPQSCESRLDHPLAPLDRATARAAVDGIAPKLFSQTPLADALSMVATDMAGAAGGTVILITDGEESCGGDPEAALAALVAAGFDVSFSIVTIGIDDPEVARRFAALAESVAGTYVEAADAEGLRAAIEAALETPFEVVDSAGEVVARGRVGGEPVELPQGIYTVRVLSVPVEVITDVRVPGDGAAMVAAGER